MAGQQVRGVTKRDSVLVALGLSRAASPADIADAVAAAAGLEAPRTALDVVLLADLVDALAETCADYAGRPADPVQMAGATHAKLSSRWSAEQRREVGRDVGADRLDDVLKGVVAASFAPRLGKAKLIELAGGGDGP